jgi:beta-catenin-like protein 1
LKWFIGIGTSDSDVLQVLASGEESFIGFYLNLIPLIEHPNTDIGNQVVEVIHEIVHDEEGISDQEDLEITSQLALNCLKADLLLYFNNHFRNLHKTGNNEDPDDNQAVFKMFQVIEDILELYHQVRSEDLRVVEFYSRLNSSGIIEFLIEMFKQDPKMVKTESLSRLLSPGDYANRLYAAELTSTIFQLSAIDLKHENSLIEEAVNKMWTSSIDGLIIIESLLVSISAYRSRDPVDSDEQEYLFNLFDCLASLLLNSSLARNLFSNERCEGFQLFLMLLKEVNVARIRATQIVDYVLAPEDSNNLAINFINSGGLKVISPILMGKGTQKLLKSYPKLLLSLDSDEGHVCAIVASLFKNISTDSSAYFRLISKFLDNSGEKFLKLIKFHEKYSEKLKKFDEIHGISKDQQMEEEWLLDRINSGLFVLQQIDICLLVLENSLKVLNLIKNNSESHSEIELELFNVVYKESEAVFKVPEVVLGEVKENVKEFIDNLDEKSTIKIIPLLKTFL